MTAGGNPIETLEQTAEQAAAIQAIIESLPMSEPEKRAARKAAGVRMTPRRQAVANAYAADKIVADAGSVEFSRNLRVSELLVALYPDQLEDQGNGSMVFADSDGSFVGGRHIAYAEDEDGIEKFVAYGTYTAEVLGVPDGDDSGGFDSARYVSARYCGGDSVLAGLFLAKYRGDSDALIEFLETDPDIDKVKAIASIAGEVEADRIADSIAEGIFDGKVGHFQITDTLSVRTGSKDTIGLWETVGSYDEKGTHVSREERVTDWVMFRHAERLDHSAAGATDKSYDIVLVDSDLAVHSLTGVSAADSLSPQILRMRFSAGIRFDSSPSVRDKVADMLDILGKYDRSRIELRRYTGWTEIDGKATFLGMAGSVNADGIDLENRSAPLKGLDESDREANAPRYAVGFARVPEDIRAAAKAVPAFLDIIPNKRRAGVAMLGMAFAAPLALSDRAALDLQSVSDSGKSLACSGLQSFWMVGLPMRKFLIALVSDSPTSTKNWLAWNRHLLAIADDARTNGASAQENIKSTALTAELHQLGYGQAAGGKANASGGAQKRGQVVSPVMFTAEILPEQTAILNRSVSVRLEMGDIVLSAPEGQDAPIDTFFRTMSETGVANSMYASYLQFLAQGMDDGTLRGTDPTLSPLAALGQWGAQKAKDAYRRLGANRTAEVVGYVGAGWEGIFAWAEHHGVADVLPSRAEVDAELRQLVFDSSTTVHGADPGEILLQAVAGGIESGKFHLLSADSDRPKHNKKTSSHLSGWKRRDYDSSAAEWESRGSKAGHWSADGRWILILPSALKDAAKLDRRISTKTEMEIADAAFAKCDKALSYNPKSKDSKCSTKMGIGSRGARGYVFSAAQLGLEDAMPEEVPAASAVAVADTGEDSDF
jgi:hypothetical protein